MTIMATATVTAQPVVRDFYGRVFEDAWIVSVYWRRKSEQIEIQKRLPGGMVIPYGFRDVTLEAAPRDGYNITVVNSGGVHIPTFPNQDAKPGIQHIAMGGLEIATRIVDNMTRESGGGGGVPGIAVLPSEEIIGTELRSGLDREGEIIEVETPIPSDVFLAGLRRRQEPLAHYRVNQAIELYKEQPTAVTEAFREACRWLYGEDAKNTFEWMGCDSVRRTKPCPRCGTDNTSSALGCVKCPCEFSAFYTRRGMTPEEVDVFDPKVAQDMRDLMVRNKRVKPAAEAIERMRANWKADDEGAAEEAAAQQE